MRKHLSKNSAKHFLVIMSAAATVTLGMTPNTAHAAEQTADPAYVVEATTEAVAEETTEATTEATIATEAVAEVAEEPEVLTADVKTGWVEEGGYKYYYDYSGNKITNRTYWIWDDTAGDSFCYHFDAEGRMVTGWYEDEYGDWYYYNADGRAAEGVVEINGYTYYFSSYGCMYKDEAVIIDGTFYYFGKDGYMTAKTSASTNGWVQAGDDWYYLKEGSYVSDEWVQSGGYWYYFRWDGKMVSDTSYGIWDEDTDKSDYYYFDENGHMVTGWQKIDGDWYYFEADGKAADGIRELGGQTYYFSTGRMEESTKIVDGNALYCFGTDGTMLWKVDFTKDGWVNTKDGYYYVQDGALVKDQLIQYGGSSYYMNSEGIMIKNTTKYIDGSYYRFATDGRMVTGWYKDAGVWYYYKTDGKPVSGLQTIDGKEYYFYDGGAMCTDSSVAFDGYIYYFDKDGNVAKKVEIATAEGWIGMPDDTYYYAKNGELVYYDWVEVGGAKYFMDSAGKNVADASGYYIMGDCYCFDENGRMVTGWYQDKYGDWYYLDKDGKAVSGEQTIDGKKYYFHSDGEMMVSQRFFLDDVYYSVDKNGILTTYPVENGWVDDYLYFENGKKAGEGWKNLSGVWYYFDEDGDMLRSSSLVSDGKTYRFNSDGAMVIGWYKDYEYDSDWSYYKADGTRAEDEWQLISGAWYYFDSYGDMETGLRYIDGYDKRQFFSADGVWMGELDMKEDKWFTDGKEWYYIKDGSFLTWGTEEIDGETYGFRWNGKMITNDYDYGYYFGADGRAFKNGWRKSDTNEWYYHDEDGRYVADDWMQIDGVWYYFDGSGKMLRNCDYKIDGDLNSFAESGAWIGTNANPFGWTLINGLWSYYQDGNKVTGWQAIDNAMYYFNNSGVMSYYTTVEENDDYYWVDKNGQWVSSGWIERKNGDKIDSDWYYAGEDGSLCKGLQTIGGKTYYFNEYGNPWLYTSDVVSEDRTVLYQHNADDSVTQVAAAGLNGWYQTADGEWFYVSGGKFVTGTQVIDGNEYYFYDSGMACNEAFYNAYADANGIVHHDGWFYDSYADDDFVDETIEEDGYWSYYRNSDRVDGVQNISGQHYYFGYGSLEGLHFVDGSYYYYDGYGNRTAQSLSEGWNYIGGHWYYVKNGSLVYGVRNIDGVYYAFTDDGRMATKNKLYDGYYVENGKLATGWRKINGNWYFFDANGKMATGTRLIGGAYYTFNRYNGAWIN